MFEHASVCACVLGVSIRVLEIERKGENGSERDTLADC